MTCSEYRELLFATRDLSMSEIHSAAKHSHECDACREETEKMAEGPLSVDQEEYVNERLAKYDRQIRTDPELRE